MILESRRCGKTTALIRAAKSINAAFVCQTQAQANAVKREYPDAKDMRVVALDNLPAGEVFSVVIYDHTVTEMALNQYHNPQMKRIRELLMPLIRELDI